MIINFASKHAQDIYDGLNSKKARAIPHELHNKARFLFDQLNAITRVDSLRIPPSNHLEKLQENLVHYWSLRINKQWRIIFRWQNNQAFDVDIIDYH